MTFNTIFIIVTFSFSILIFVLKSIIGKKSIEKYLNNNSIIFKNKSGNISKNGFFLSRKFSFDDFDIIINNDTIYICPHFNLTLLIHYSFTNKNSNKRKDLRISRLYFNVSNKLVIEYYPSKNDIFLFGYKEIILKISINNEEEINILKEFVNKYCS